MAYLIYAIDKDGIERLREAYRKQHRAHLKSAGKMLIASGALLEEDGATVIGGISLLDTDSKEVAKKFAYNDPYQKIGIRKETKIIRWRKRWLNGKFLGNSKK